MTFAGSKLQILRQSYLVLFILGTPQRNRKLASYAFLTNKDTKPREDLSSRSNAKSLSKFMVVIWYSGSAMSVLLKVHAVYGKWCSYPNCSGSQL